LHLSTPSLMKTIDLTISDHRQQTRWLMRPLDGKWLTESMTSGLMAASLNISADAAINYACSEHDRHADNLEEGENQ
jgi:hypothetical protein